jgi:hypothetical protein
VFEFNEPVWVLEVIPGFFECYLDHRDNNAGIRVGVPGWPGQGGFGAIVPTEWITRRENP